MEAIVTKEQSLVVIIGCLVAVLMCIGVIVLLQQSAQAVVGGSESANAGSISAELVVR